jgi:hypothetical protein
MNSIRTEDLTNATKKEIELMVDNINEELGVQPGDLGYIAKRGKKKEDLVSIIQTRQQMNSEDITPFSKIDSTRKTVKLSQVEINPSNFRHAADYHDEDLQRSLKMSGGFIGELVVIESERSGTYYPLGGNRTLYNLKHILTQEGIDHFTFDIDILIRKYSGEENEIVAQQTIEMFNDNERGLSHSPVDKLKVFNTMLKSGLNQTKIGDTLGCSQAYVSQTLKLGYLPARILELVHFSHHSEKLSAHSSEYKDSMNMPTDNNGKVLGIPLANANAILDFYPKKSDSEFKDFKQKMDVLLEKEDVLKAAMSMNCKEFSTFFKLSMIEHGVIHRPVKTEPALEISSTYSSKSGGTVVNNPKLDAELASISNEEPVEIYKSEEIHKPQQHEQIQNSEEIKKTAQTKQPELEAAKADALELNVVNSNTEDLIKEEDDVEPGGYELAEQILSGKIIFEDMKVIVETLVSDLKQENKKAMRVLDYLMNNNLVYVKRG